MTLLFLLLGTGLLKLRDLLIGMLKSTHHGMLKLVGLLGDFDIVERTYDEDCVCIKVSHIRNELHTWGVSD